VIESYLPVRREKIKHFTRCFRGEMAGASPVAEYLWLSRSKKSEFPKPRISGRYLRQDLYQFFGSIKKLCQPLFVHKISFRKRYSTLTNFRADKILHRAKWSGVFDITGKMPDIFIKF